MHHHFRFQDFYIDETLLALVAVGNVYPHTVIETIAAYNKKKLDLPANYKSCLRQLWTCKNPSMARFQFAAYAVDVAADIYR